MLEEEAPSVSCSPGTSEPSSPSLPSTPFFDDDTDESTDWNEDDAFYVKRRCKHVHVYDVEETAGDVVDVDEMSRPKSSV